jgi:hypothetical protein
VTAALICNAHAQYRRGPPVYVDAGIYSDEQGYVGSGANHVPPGSYSGNKMMTVATPINNPPSPSPAPPEESGPQVESPKTQDNERFQQDSPFKYQREYRPPPFPFPRYNFAGAPFYTVFNRPGYVGGPPTFGYNSPSDFTFGNNNPIDFSNGYDNNFGYFNAPPHQSYHIRREYDDKGECRLSQKGKEITPVSTTTPTPIPQANFHQRYDVGPDGFSAQGQGSSSNAEIVQEQRRPDASDFNNRDRYRRGRYQ